ncbi:MAG: condensation domain-containing protein, partial [Longimicrobiales bacterium]
MSTRPELQTGLSPDEREALLAELSQSAVEKTGYPLSFAQQRLWFLDQLMPQSSAYNLDMPLRLPIALDIDALERSLNEIVRRHEALRTIFRAVGGEPFQIVLPALRLQLNLVDLTTLPEPEREAETSRLAYEQGRRPFKLAEGPLLRTTLVRLSNADHVLLVTMHHIVADGWSIELFFRELWLLYIAFTDGQPSPLAELKIQYVDFAVWQRKWLQGEVLTRQLAYWGNRLDGLPRLELPTDRIRPPVQSFQGAYHWFTIPPSLTEQLKALSRREGATLFMTLLAAFQT